MMESMEDPPAYVDLPAKIAGLPSSQGYAALPDDERKSLYRAAGHFLLGVTAHLSALAAKHDGKIAEAHAYHKALLAAKKEDTEAPQQIRGRLVGLMTNYEAVERQRQAELTARLEAEARKAEDETRLLEATMLEADGRRDEALALIDKPSAAPLVHVERAVPRMAGIGMRENWSAECVDLLALVKAVATGQVPLVAVMANPVVLNQAARALKLEMRWPGCRAINRPGIATRRE